MAVKIICLVICALLLFICYRAQFFAERILHKKDPSDALILKIKLVALAVSMILFICVMIFIN